MDNQHHIGMQGQQGQQGLAEADIIEGSDKSFMEDVVQMSMQKPVLVDFWAPWCEPCKQLTPILEKAITANKGAVRLVKINMDANPAIAAQLQIRSIPAVFAFYQGQPVDAFMGALPEGEIQKFIDKLLALSGAQTDEAPALSADHEHTLQQVKEGIIQARTHNQWDKTLCEQWLAALFAICEQQSDRDNTALLGQLLMDAGKLNEAEHVLQHYGGDDAQFPALKSRILLVREALAAKLPQNTPKANAEPQQLYDYARHLLTQGAWEEAVQMLLDLVKTARDFQDDAARKYLVNVMDGLEADDPRLPLWRRKFSAIIFA